MTGPTRRDFLVRAGAIGLSTSGLAGLLGACTGDDEGFDSGGTTPQPSGSSGRRMSGRLVIGIIQDPPAAAKEAITKAYRQHQPDVELVWETKDFGGTDGYVNWLGTQLAAGKIRPDLVSGNYVPTFRGYVNFEEYREAANPYTGNPWSKDIDFTAGRELNTWAQRYLMATGSAHTNWFYNKALFDKAKVEPPTTWAEFTDVCAKLQGAGITPVSANFQWQVPQWLTEIYFDQYHVNWVETVRAREGDWNFDPGIDGKFRFDPNEPNVHSLYTYSPQRFFRGIADHTLRFDTPAMAALVANFAAIFPKYATKDFLVIEDTYSPFLQQRTAIMLGGAGDLGVLKKDLAQLSPERQKELGVKPGSVKPFEWGVFENPAMEGPHVRCKPRSVESSSGEYISIVDKDAKQRELAVDFCMFWLSKVGYQPYLDAQVSAGEFAAAGPSRIASVQFPADITKDLSMVNLLGNAEVPYNQFWTAGPDQATRTELRNLFKASLDGTMAPQKYATELQSYVDKNLDRMLKASSLSRADLKSPERRPGS